MLEAESLVEEGRRGGLGTGLTTLILGAVILWVGKTTFEHAGKLAGVEHRLDGVDAKHDGLRDRYDEVVNTLAERTRSRFTREDADQLVWRVQDLEIAQDAFETKIHDRIGALRLQMTSAHAGTRPQVGNSVSHASNVVVADRNTLQLLNRLQGQVNALQADVNQLHRMVEFRRSTPIPAKNPNQPDVATRTNNGQAPAHR